MGGIFGSQKAYDPPTRDKQAEQAAEDNAARNRQKRGYQQTVLSTMYQNANKSKTLG